MSQKSIAESRVEGAGFSTTVFPIAIAGAIFQHNIRKGKFQGITCRRLYQGPASLLLYLRRDAN